MSLRIEPVLCLEGIMDNYAYLLTDEQSGMCAIVDAAEFEPIDAVCRQNNQKPSFILTTHHHFDHVGANDDFKQKYQSKIVVSNIDAAHLQDADILVKDGDEFMLGNSRIKVISAPGHTHGHVLWYFPENKVLFTGDTLFNLCIGGLFEGTTEEMWQTLQKIKGLPDDVCFYPGHEYTRANIRKLQAQQDAASKQYLEFLAQKSERGEAFVGVPLGLEKQCNRYLQIEDEQIFVQRFAGE